MTGLFGRKKQSDPSVHDKKKQLRKSVKDKQYEKALRIGAEILQKVPHENDVLFIVGSIYYMKKKFKTAISYFDKSLDIGSYDVEVLMLKANSHFELGQTRQARECCEKIQEIDPKNKVAKDLLEKTDI